LAFERHFEKEPERDDRRIDDPRAHMGLRHMQLKQTKVLGGGGIGRAAEEGGEALDVTDVVRLGLLREVTRRHVFDHALAQWANGLVGHGDSSCLKRGYEPRDFETGRAILLIPTPNAPRAR